MEGKSFSGPWEEAGEVVFAVKKNPEMNNTLVLSSTSNILR